MKGLTLVADPTKKAKDTEFEGGYDILKHSLVPKHRKLSEKEITELLAQHNISILQLPILPSNDPVAKKMNLLPGDIVEVKRDGATKGYSYYRRVV